MKDDKSINIKDIIDYLEIDNKDIEKPSDFEELRNFLNRTANGAISQFNSAKDFNDLLKRISKSKNGMLANIDTSDEWDVLKIISDRYSDRLPSFQVIEIQTSGPFEPIYFRFIKLSSLDSTNYKYRSVYAMYGVSKMAIYNQNNETWLVTISFY